MTQPEAKISTSPASDEPNLFSTFILSPAAFALATIGGVGYLLLDASRQIHRALFAKRGRRMGWRNLWAQMDRVGVRSVPIVSLVLFCIGAILALQMAPVLRGFGVIEMTADVISVAIFRELGPLVSAVVLTGFAGASIAAELGTMVVSEEIEALEAHAVDPIRFLVVPRVVATIVMMVCIAMIGNLMGVLGGLAVGRFLLGIGTSQYLTHTFSTILHLRDFLTGLIKAGVFGAIISALACYLGLQVTGGAQGVGVATTRTVVFTIVALIFVDLLFTGVFYAIGW
jgi:phospholipid/cholesterol/gamma-HCH transport system permease protein